MTTTTASTTAPDTHLQGSWSAASYSWLMPGHGGAKLAASGVAPLVAAARGYATITEDTRQEMASKLGIGNLSTPAGKQLRSTIGDADVLFMPWYGLAATATAVSAGTQPERTMHQLRPATPGPGQPKYTMPKGSATPVDSHPATPRDWFAEAPQVLIAEGLIKADAALTAMLIHAGVSADLLGNGHGGNAALARTALAAAMETVPSSERILILALVSSTTWHSHPDWNAVSFKGRTVLVGLDADVHENAMVWDQASKMLEFAEGSKGAVAAHLVAVPPVNGDRKAGLDDWLAAGGVWGTLPEMLRNLPPRPAPVAAQGLEVADVDLAAGTTTTTEVVKTPQGGSTLQTRTLADAALRVETITTHTPAFEGQESRTVYSGSASWVARGQVTVKKFKDLDADLFLSRTPNPRAILAKATAHRAVGARTVASRAQDIVDAWIDSANDAESMELVASSGLWEHEGRLGHLTSDGWVGPDGVVDASVRSDLPLIHRIELPAYRGGAADQGRLADAIRLWAQAGSILHAGQRGLWELTSGQALAIGALDVQARGSVILSGPKGTGKTSFLQMAGGWNGREWLTEDPNLLSGTRAQMEAKFDGPNGIVIPMDDFRNAAENSTSHKLANEAEDAKLFVQDGVRMGYAPAALREKQRRGARGFQAQRKLKNARRAMIFSAEDVALMELSSSSVQRVIAFQVDGDHPLFRTSGEVAPMIEELVETQALGVIKAAMIRTAHQRAEAAAEAQPELSLHEAYQAATVRLLPLCRQMLSEAEPSLTERDQDFLAPAFVALYRLRRMAIEVMGETEANELMGADAGMAALLSGWRRNQQVFGARGRAPWRRYLEALVTAEATWYATKNDTVDPATYLHRTRKGEITILPDGAVTALNRRGFRLTETQLKSALAEAIQDPRQQVRLHSYAGGRAYGWRIYPHCWDEAGGGTAGESADAERMTSSGTPAPAEPGTVANADMEAEMEVEDWAPDAWDDIDPSWLDHAA